MTSARAPPVTSLWPPPLLLLLLAAAAALPAAASLADESAGAFPGVERDLAAFCSARPSLSVELAPMVVHVKRNNSFNYKLYLFSGEYVFQTGQIVPRDNFRIHSFPVKFKPFSEFWPGQRVPTYAAASGAADPQLMTQVASSSFNARRFFRLVPLLADGAEGSAPRGPRELARPEAPADARGQPLPGDGHANFNRHIQFDRDDQLAPLGADLEGAALGDRAAKLERDLTDEPGQWPPSAGSLAASFATNSRLVLPVGSFSSFKVNLTYLARKDFGQTEPELIGVHIDPVEFRVARLEVLHAGASGAANQSSSSSSSSSSFADNQLGGRDDFGFLTHRLLRDQNTRLVSISQIYENWITRNFYTIVYVQRRLEAPAAGPAEPVSERLIFRGSSAALLGAEQLDYQVKSSAFITEKNNLHYYLEFLANGKFYVGAVDWSRRPFKFINWQKFPNAKTARTQFDNEELLLCPPAVCYSEQPIDELVAYGRLAMDEVGQRFVGSLVSSSSRNQLSGGSGDATRQLETTRFYSTAPSSSPSSAPTTDALELADELVFADAAAWTSPRAAAARRRTFERLVAALALSGAHRLETRLHLRDWVWPLRRQQAPLATASDKLSTSGAAAAGRPNSTSPIGGHKFEYLFERARRNDLKANSDSYGFALAGQEIDASYRVFNELYLISANQLIAINYTLDNETVTSTQPLADEFPGLSSSLLDPISAAFYDRSANQIYFFKGDRYVGYDYATKRPLEDFQLAAPAPPTARQQALVTSLPVVGLLGRQHRVDAVYHDFQTDLVHIITGMRFYTFPAAEFKDGAFRHERGLPPLLCVNEQLLDGCQFDAAFPNPCRPSPGHQAAAGDDDAGRHSGRLAEVEETVGGGGGGSRNVSSNSSAPPNKPQWNQTKPAGEPVDGSEAANATETRFGHEQQQKLRSIAARGGGGLLDYLVDGALLNRGAPLGPALAPAEVVLDQRQLSSSHERIVVYLLMALVAITILVTVAMIAIMLNWTRNQADQKWAQQAAPPGEFAADELGVAGGPAVLSADNFATILHQYHGELLASGANGGGGGGSTFQAPPTQPWQQFAPPALEHQQRHLRRSGAFVASSSPPPPVPHAAKQLARHGQQVAGAASSSASSAGGRRPRSKIDSSAL